MMPKIESTFEVRRRTYGLIRKGILGPEVVSLLLPEGDPFLYEKQLWDYKSELPAQLPQAKPSDTEVARYNAKMADVVKDAVAMYNSYGGYLVIGVNDNPRAIIGFTAQFNCDDLNKRIYYATKHEVDCHFGFFECPMKTGTKTIGIVLVPQRSEHREPAQFLRDAPKHDNGRLAYRKHELYLRVGDECRPAHTSDDYTFLCSQGRRQFVAPTELGLTSVLCSNLGPRDPGFIQFIGRDEYLQDLWRWLCDRFSPARLLAGLGGVGKTTIAREFAEAVARSAPLGLENVIWLSAKKQFYAAVLEKYVPTTRVDFNDVDTMLRAILLELGSTADMLSDEWSRDELLEETISTLRVMPSLVIIDDLDSLEADQQHEAFHTILQVTGQTMGSSSIVPSRALLTARLDLGAAPAQLVRVKGLDFPQEFRAFVGMTSDSLGLNLSLSTKRMSKFYRITDGSPTFASSILRLLQMGESLESALEKWQGSDGEEVRAFAFRKELHNLNESQIRTLYAACQLGETSLLELQQITRSSETLLRDDIGELRKYHLLALGSEVPGGGARLLVPSGIRLMSDLIRGYVRDPNRVQNDCAKARAGSPSLGPQVSPVVHQAVALWRDNRPEDTVALVRSHVRKNSDNPDLHCLLGRAYLRLPTVDARKADATFRKASDLGCKRPELMTLWIEAKQILRDWVGIIEITRLADKTEPTADNAYARGRAFEELATIAINTGNLPTAAEYFREGGRDVDHGFRQKRAIGRVTELADLRAILFDSYIAITDRIAIGSRDHLQVWLAVVDAFNCYVRRPAMILFGAERLRTWWGAMLKEKRNDARATSILRTQIERLDAMIDVIAELPIVQPGLVDNLSKIRNELGKSSQHGDSEPTRMGRGATHSNT